MEHNVKISILLDLYGKLLTEKQYKLLDDYYNNDLSLSEIAENVGITRQAVRDNLKKGENNLFEYEDKLGLMEKMVIQEKNITNIICDIREIEKAVNNQKIKNTIKKIEEKLNSLI